MFRAHKRSFPWSIKLPVLILYLAFFTVQIFFNFDIAQKTTVAQKTYGAISVSSDRENIKQVSSKSLPTSKIRLNKRFQPSTIPIIFHDLVIVPVAYSELKLTSLSEGNLYAFAYLATHTLRGPPVIA
jgi:hypothetical protein